MDSYSSCLKKSLCHRSMEELGVGKTKIKWKSNSAEAFLNAAFRFAAHTDADGIVLTSSAEEFLELCAYLLIRVLDREATPVQNRRGAVKGLRLPFVSLGKIIDQTERCDLLQNDEGAALFLRAAFLCCGTVLDPARGYHVSFRVRTPEDAAYLQRVLSSRGIIAKTRAGKEAYFVYLKGSDRIVDLFALIGAQKDSLELVNQKIERSIRANINRRQNFDGANLKKTVDGAQSVIASIRYLAHIGVLVTLPESLQKAAKLRLSYPELSLGGLVEHSEETITKSGLNHRFQKLITLAETYRKEESES